MEWVDAWKVKNKMIVLDINWCVTRVHCIYWTVALRIYLTKLVYNNHDRKLWEKKRSVVYAIKRIGSRGSVFLLGKLSLEVLLRLNKSVDLAAFSWPLLLLYVFSAALISMLRGALFSRSIDFSKVLVDHFLYLSATMADRLSTSHRVSQKSIFVP